MSTEEETSTAAPRAKSGQRKLLQQERQLRKLQRQWDSLAPDEQEAVELLATYEMLKERYTTQDDGKVISLWDYAVDRELEVLAAETGFGRSTKVDTEQLTRTKPGWMLRQGAHKMQLRPEEEERLELTCMGRGFRAQFTVVHDVPFLGDLLPPELDFSYGVFCRADRVRQLMARKYAGRDPKDVLTKRQYYQDVILHSPQLETTAMVVLVRDLDIKALGKKYTQMLQDQLEAGLKLTATTQEGQVVNRVEAGPSDYAQLEDLKLLFTPAGLKGLPIASANGKRLLKDTKLFFTTRPDGGMCIEAESPGTLSEQKSLLLYEFDSKVLTYAVHDTLYGSHAIDPVARTDIGACYLYFANGFDFDPKSKNPRRTLLSPEILGNKDKYFSGTEFVGPIPAPASITLSDFVLDRTGQHWTPRLTVRRAIDWLRERLHEARQLVSGQAPADVLFHV